MHTRQLPRRWRLGLIGLGTSLVLLTAAVTVRHWPRAPLSAGVPSSTAVLAANGQLLRLTLAADQRYRLWLPLADYPPALIDAVLLHEDAWFRWHPGVNPLSLLRGAWSSYVSGDSIVGGSTLSMQLARLRWKLHTRSIRGKLLQIGRALQLELCYSKNDILEAYLNLAPYGGNIEGAGTAARIYFGKPAQQLSLPEVLSLAVLPQSPSRRGRFVHSADGQRLHAGAGLQAARDRLYRRWRARHGADPATDALMQLPLALRAPQQLPFRAPHLVDRVLAGRRTEGPLPATLTTTLDWRLQQLIERRVRQYLRFNAHKGLDNAAVMVVDHRSMEVRALLGSANFFDPAIHGQVNGTAAKRSPGSTLKPLIYALALDQGIIHPQTVLRDVPTAFGPYTPENFDGRFVGPVTATEALIRSRNVPAVSIEAQLQRPRLYDLLRAAGVSQLRSEQHYGLALVLGGGEVSMEELARLYGLLANDGQLRALRWRSDQPEDAGTPLISAAAAYITLDMLRQQPRPGGALASDLGQLPVAWKTGTSWGFHDAWSVGVVGSYLLLVWIGHFDGRANPAFVGVDAAAPLFFDLVDAMRAAGEPLQQARLQLPERLARVEVCSASGDLPNRWCPATTLTWFIPGVSPIRLSTVHRPVFTDRVSGQVVCAPYDPQRMHMEIYEFWPSDLARVFAQAGLPRRKPPPGSDCRATGSGMGSAPQISSPLRATRYLRRIGATDEIPIALSATADADARQLYWFADGAYLGSAEVGSALGWTPLRSGTLRLSVTDDLGRSDSRDVRIDARP